MNDNHQDHIDSLLAEAISLIKRKREAQEDMERLQRSYDELKKQYRPH